MRKGMILPGVPVRYNPRIFGGHASTAGLRLEASGLRPAHLRRRNAECGTAVQAEGLKHYSPGPHPGWTAPVTIQFYILF